MLPNNKKNMDLNITTFPEELLEIIISKIDNKDIKNIGQTCSRINKIVNKCIERQHIYDKKVSVCFICMRRSINYLPIHDMVWSFVGDMITHQICSQKCRRACLNLYNVVFGEGFYIP